MPARTPTRIAALASLLATLAPAGPVMAEAPGYTTDAVRRAAPRRFPDRPLPPAAGYDVHRRSPYGASPGYGPVVRAYLPRDHSVPMYNEPPAR